LSLIDTSGASTHIHVGPVGRPWSRAEIVSIGEGINLISDIIPVLPRWADTERTANWAKKNPQGAFNNSSTIQSVVESLCPERNVAWNLRPMFEEPNQRVKGTNKFQRPPQSRSAGEVHRPGSSIVNSLPRWDVQKEKLKELFFELARPTDKYLFYSDRALDLKAFVDSKPNSGYN
jgi:hypothetical protein